MSHAAEPLGVDARVVTGQTVGEIDPVDGLHVGLKVAAVPQGAKPRTDRTVGLVSETSDPIDLNNWQRWLLMPAVSVLLLFGLWALLARGLDGLATTSLLVGAMVLFLMALIGVFPGSVWLRVDREAKRLHDLNSQIEADGVLRSVAAAAALLENARVRFWTRHQAFMWDASVIGEGREIVVKYLPAGSTLAEIVPSDVWRPERVEQCILIIHNDTESGDGVYSTIQEMTEGNGYAFDNAVNPMNLVKGANTHRTEISVCGSRYPDIHEHVTALLTSEYGGSGHPLVQVFAMSTPARTAT